MWLSCEKEKLFDSFIDEQIRNLLSYACVEPALPFSHPLLTNGKMFKTVVN